VLFIGHLKDVCSGSKKSFKLQREVDGDARSTAAGLDASAHSKKTLIANFLQFQTQNEVVSSKHQALLADLRKKDESYARRENDYQEEIKELRDKLALLVLPQPKDDRALTKIGMHSQMIERVSSVHHAHVRRRQSSDFALTLSLRLCCRHAPPEIMHEQILSQMEALDKTAETAKQEHAEVVSWQHLLP